MSHRTDIAKARIARQTKEDHAAWWAAKRGKAAAAIDYAASMFRRKEENANPLHAWAGEAYDDALAAMADDLPAMVDEIMARESARGIGDDVNLRLARRMRIGTGLSFHKPEDIRLLAFGEGYEKLMNAARDEDAFAQVHIVREQQRIYNLEVLVSLERKLGRFETPKVLARDGDDGRSPLHQPLPAAKGWWGDIKDRFNR